MTTTRRSLIDRAIFHVRTRRDFAFTGAVYRPQELPLWQRRVRSLDKVAEALSARVYDIAVIDGLARS